MFKKKKKKAFRFKPTLLDISSHCYKDDNVKVMFSQLYNYLQYGTVYGSNCANTKICRRAIWKGLILGVKVGSILIITWYLLYREI